MRQRLITIIAAIAIATGCLAQRRYVIQHKPYIDLRPMHFGISVGMNLQDIEFKTEAPIVCDVDRWNAGFSVGVLADMLSAQKITALQEKLEAAEKDVDYWRERCERAELLHASKTS